ncbi:SIR2 family protein [Gemmatimonas groenlandica]|uniref:Fibronectin-binding protein (FBP) n=1 Tax=Gemmatimonas groenlandica TaxID=2732249 RepID=A0A6M4INF0_9BACT|nr:SIR2 family protein [Gemmatimonas groenlandica]QJR36524.1 fibronectin-binding protein (FBP) [Gemmatimonas groenlandica]
MTVGELKEHLKSGGQVLKTRDDHGPVFLNRTVESTGPDLFTLPAGAQCSWAKSAETFGPERLRPRIEPWLTALVQSEHLSLLVGSGLTHAVHWLGTGAGLPGMSGVTFQTLDDEIAGEVTRAASAAGRENGNFEDQIRVANELLRGLEILAAPKENDSEQKNQASALRSDLEGILKSFAMSILQGERSLAEAEATKREDAFNYLTSFLLSFASRAGTRERLQLFTTNYDRFIEAGADVAGLRLIDRFVGTLAPVFRASRLDVDLHYNPPGIRGEPRYLEGVARFTKLHGSVDWLASDGAIRRIGLPFGAEDIRPFVAAPGLTGVDASALMIYPNAAKDRETTAFPYVELFRDFAASICRPNSTVVCYGYSFGDEHINRVIEDMLTIPSAHLVVIAHGDPLGRIMRTYERLGRHAQVTLLIGNHLGDLQALVDHYLPKPAIDRTTFRMAELLKARWGTEPRPATESEVPPASGEGST